MKIPGQAKLIAKQQEAKLPPEEKKKRELYRAIMSFPARPNETIIEAMDRFEKERNLKVPQGLRDMILQTEEDSRKNEGIIRLAKEAKHLEEFMEGFTDYMHPDNRQNAAMQRTNFASWCSIRDKRAGLKLYQVTLGLAERLAFTDLRGLPSTSIRLPFEAIQVEIPISLAFGIEALEMPKTLLIQEEVPGGETAQDGVSRVWNMVLIPTKDLGAVRDSNNIVIGRLFLWDDLKWNDCVKRSLKAKYSLCPTIEPQTQATMFATFGNEDIRSRLFSLAGNLVLYATNHNARAQITNKEYVELTARIDRMPASAKKEKLKERRRSLDPSYKIVLGTGIKPLPDVMREGNKINVRTLVSGFWRDQVYGKAKDEDGKWIPANLRPHEQKWIMPFYRGLELGDDAPETNPIRVMKELEVSKVEPCHEYQEIGDVDIEAILNSPVSPEMLSLAQEAIDAQKKFALVPAQEWAAKLAQDVSVLDD